VYDRSLVLVNPMPDTPVCYLIMRCCLLFFCVVYPTHDVIHLSDMLLRSQSFRMRKEEPAQCHPALSSLHSYYSCNLMRIFFFLQISAGTLVYIFRLPHKWMSGSRSIVFIFGILSLLSSDGSIMRLNLILIGPMCSCLFCHSPKHSSFA
jgi:hypothetical protein